MGGGDKVPNLSQPECLKEWVVSTTTRPLYLRKDPGPIVRGGGGGSLDGHGNSRYHKDSIPRPPGRIEWLLHHKSQMTNEPIDHSTVTSHSIQM